MGSMLAQYLCKLDFYFFIYLLLFTLGFWTWNSLWVTEYSCKLCSVVFWWLVGFFCNEGVEYGTARFFGSSCYTFIKVMCKFLVLMQNLNTNRLKTKKPKHSRGTGGHMWREKRCINKWKVAYVHGTFEMVKQAWKVRRQAFQGWHLEWAEFALT